MKFDPELQPIVNSEILKNVIVITLFVRLISILFKLSTSFRQIIGCLFFSKSLFLVIKFVIINLFILKIINQLMKDFKS